ncbi:MAG TPA: RNA polymerase sigma factor [Pseudonocardiaceae bacterium]
MTAVHEDAGPEVDRLRELLIADLDTGFAELVRLYQDIVYATLLRACQHPADAEDLAAEAFLRAYRALADFDRTRIAELRPRPWLVTIALNTWRNSVRDRGRRPAQVSLDELVDQPAQTDDFAAADNRIDLGAELAELVDLLPEKQRIAVVLRHVTELSVPEVAEVLRVPEGTVRSHISRGLSRLRSELAQRRSHEVML